MEPRPITSARARLIAEPGLSAEARRTGAAFGLPARRGITSGVRPERRRGGLVRAFQLLHNMSLVLAIACVARTVQYGVGQIGLVGTSHIAFNERLPTKLGGRKP